MGFLRHNGDLQEKLYRDVKDTFDLFTEEELAAYYRTGELPERFLAKSSKTRLRFFKPDTAPRGSSTIQSAEEAVRNTYTWVTEHTETFNEHWQVEGRPSAYKHFPKYEYFANLFDIFDAERIDGSKIP